MSYYEKNMVAYIILLSLTVILLSIYGIVLAEQGIDHDVAMTIGGTIGAIFGYGVRELVSLLRSEKREKEMVIENERSRNGSYGDNNNGGRA